MNRNFTQKEINPFDLYAIQIFEVERQHPLHNRESLPYSDAELRALQRMAAYIESYIIARPRRFKSFVSFRKNRPYFRDQMQWYYDLKKNSLEEKRFPEPDFFLTPRLGYEYVVIANRDWIVPSYDRDIYSLFFAFKIRNLPIQSIPSLLDFQYGRFTGDFQNFLNILLVEWQELLDSKHQKIIQKWLEEKFPQIFPSEKQLESSSPEIQTLVSAENIYIKNKEKAFMVEYSNAQKVLIVFYSLHQLNLMYQTETDMTQVARFMNLLFNKNVNHINNSTFYRHLKDAPNVNEPDQLLKDLKKIKPRFEKAKMDIALKLIDEKIAEISKKIELQEKRK